MSNVLDALTGFNPNDPDAGGGTGDITQELRNKIKGAVDSVVSAVSQGGLTSTGAVLEAISFEDITDPTTDSTVIQARLQSFIDVIEDQETNLASQILNLKALVTSAITPLSAGNFFSSDQVNDTALNAVSDYFETGLSAPFSVSPQYQALSSVLGNTQEALLRLREFQALFGSESLDDITAVDAEGLAIQTDSAVSYGVGFTGELSLIHI